MSDAAPSRARVAAAFAIVYLVWGSTYLAIRFAIETLPPLLMAGARFLVAGAILYGFARARGAPRPTWRHLRNAGLVGALLLLGGNGLVVWAEQRVPSGIAALLVAVMPLWMALLGWLRPRGRRPSATTILGLLLGLGGVALLSVPGSLAGARAIDPLGATLLCGAALSWACGSLIAREASLPRSTALANGLEMVCGGLLLLVAGGALGEWRELAPSAVSVRSLLALLYLVTFGSLLAFSAYTFLLRVAPPATVATYAYVNPVVAVGMGWAIAGEPVTARTIVAAAIILGAVVIITIAQPRRGQAPAPKISAGR